MLRKLALVLVPLAACSVVVSAQAATPTQLTLQPAAYKILYGKKLTLTGKLVGGLAGRNRLDHGPAVQQEPDPGEARRAGSNPPRRRLQHQRQADDPDRVHGPRAGA